jgi:hypothetical protein
MGPKHCHASVSRSSASENRRRVECRDAGVVVEHYRNEERRPSKYATHIMQTTVFELGNTTRSPESRQHQEDMTSEDAETRLEQSRLPESR